MKTNLKVKSRKQQGQRGIALVMVMIIILTLSAIVGGFAYSMKVEMRLARNSDYDNDLIWMGRSGVEVARYLLTVKPPGMQNIDALNQKWAGGISVANDNLPDVPTSFELVCGASGTTANVSYKIIDMSAKFDINWVVNPQFPQNLAVLQNCLNQMGVTDSGLAQTIVDSIQDWVGPRNTQARSSGAKDDYYLNQEPPYYCKCGWIDDIKELLLIKGIKDHPEIFWGSNSKDHPMSAYEQKAQNSPFLRDREQPSYPFGLNDIFCAGSQQMNVNTASARVLQMIPGMDAPGLAEDVQKLRAGVDGVDGNEDDAPFQNPMNIFTAGQGPGVPGPVGGGVPGGGLNLTSLIGIQSKQFEVQVTCQINGYSKEYIAILRRNPGKITEFQVLQFYWK